MNCEREALLWCDIGGNVSPRDGIYRQGICNSYVRPLGHRSGNPSRSLLGIGVPSLLKWPRWAVKVKGQRHRFGPMSRRFILSVRLRPTFRVRNVSAFAITA